MFLSDKLDLVALYGLQTFYRKHFKDFYYDPLYDRSYVEKEVI